MKWISAEEVAASAPYRDIVETLRKGFASPVETPVRHHHETGSATLLLMPAWSKEWTGLKLVTIKPDNAAKGLPTVQAAYTLIDNATGTPVVSMDGTELTRRRTAAASALAADYLARKDAEVLAVIGAGALAKHFVLAHAGIRPIKKVLVFNRTADKADTLVKDLQALGLEARVSDVEKAVKLADIVSCVTSSSVPLVEGAWLKPGTHLDLAGAFKPTMREIDGNAVSMARVYVDTRDGAEAEAGDLLQARAEGKFDFANVQGDLSELCRGKVKGRNSPDEITLFKSCGTALEDLATAVMVHLRKG
jgi:ornithine cyclodeaminase/alanine dehydrogenase-like protein (mu-crystallin family)